MNISYTYIENEEELNKYCQRLSSVKCIAIDTEFISEKTFSPLLCLIIIHSELGSVIIDPFPIKNFEALHEILLNENIVKISHAGENDYKIFYNDFGIMPVNVFDTQIAAGLVYNDYAVSLEKLVYRELKVSLPKTSTVSDWSKRPLSKKQLEYAVYDVCYLIQIMDILVSKLKKANKEPWLDLVQTNLISVERFTPGLEEQILKLRSTSSIRENELLWIYRSLKWRETEARAKNFNKSRLFKNKEIKDIYRLSREGENAWTRHRRFKYVKHVNWKKLHQYTKTTMTDDERLAIERIQASQVAFNRVDTKELMTDILFTSLKYLLQDRISITLIVNKDLIRNLVYKTSGSSDLLPQWKREILGKDITELLLTAHSKTLDISHTGIKFV